MVRSLTHHALKDQGETANQRSDQNTTKRAAVSAETDTRAAKSDGTMKMKERGKRSTTEVGVDTAMTQVKTADDATVDIGVREITTMNTVILHITLLFSLHSKNALTLEKARGLSLPVICQSMIISVHNRSTSTSQPQRAKVISNCSPSLILRRKSNAKKSSAKPKWRR